MDCEVCTDQFDEGERRPKVLPCGHTFCARCIQRLPKYICPVDRKDFQGPVNNLPDNFTLIKLFWSAAGPAGPVRRLWCRNCNREAADQCLDEHVVCSLKAVRSEEAGPRLEALQQSKAALEECGRLLEAAVGNLQPQLEDCRGHAAGQLAALAEARRQLQAALEADPALWERAKQTAQDSSNRCQAVAQLTTALADPASTCRVTLRSVTPSGSSTQGVVEWRGSVLPGKDAAATILLCQLACKGRLRRQEQAAQPTESSSHSSASRQPAVDSTQEVQPAAGPPQVQHAVIEKIDLRDLSQACRTKRLAEKKVVLRRLRQHGVRRIKNVHCNGDPRWVRQVLQCAAPTLEQLQVWLLDKELLRVLCDMRRLRRLHVSFSNFNEMPVADTLQSVLRAVGPSLQELWLDMTWNDTKDLATALEACSPLALTRLVLGRILHDATKCPAQLATVKRVLPGVTVQCSTCRLGRLGRESF